MANFDPFYDSFTYFNGGYFVDGIADDDWYYDYYEWSDLNPYYGAFGLYDPVTDQFEWEEEEITLE